MSTRELLKLGLKPGPTREWLYGDHARVQIDPTRGVAVSITLEGAVCVDRDEANTATCTMKERAGAMTSDCPARGYRLSESGSRDARVEIFAPLRPATGCAVSVVPGTSIGPVHLGMGAEAVTSCGLGLVGSPPYPLVLFSFSRAYQVDLEGKPPSVAFIRLQLTDGLGACVGGKPLSPALEPDALCSLGFCGCSTSPDPLQPDTSHVLCASQGIEFTFQSGLRQIRVLAAQATHP